MLDNQKIARFIAERRKAIGITQAEAAQRLNVTFQTVSNGKTVRCHVLKCWLSLHSF